MSRLSVGSAALAAAGMMVLSGVAGAQETTRIDPSALQSAGCFGQAACDVEGVQLSVSSGTIVSKVLNGATGFGVSGGASGPEIDLGETLTVHGRLPAAQNAPAGNYSDTITVTVTY